MARTASAQRPSIRDVARKAGVSPGCVSNVMNGRRQNDDAIGRAVLTAVQELGYRRNIMASNLRRSRSRIIGLVIPDFENPFFAELVAQLERRAEEAGYRIVAASSRERPDIEAREIGELSDWRAAGILLVPALGAGGDLDTGDAPIVLMDRVDPRAALDQIAVNNTDAAATAMRRLIDLGHRRIAVAYLEDGIDNIEERILGARRAAEDAGETVTVDYIATGGDIAGARARIAAALDSDTPPTAIFSLFNPATLAAFGLAQERGLVIGRDISLIGFDDSAWMSHVHPPVAAIVQPVAEIAKRAFDRLLSRIEGAPEPAAITRVPCHIVERGSLATAPPD